MNLLYHFAPIVEEYYLHYDTKGDRRTVAYMIRQCMIRQNSNSLINGIVYG